MNENISRKNGMRIPKRVPNMIESRETKTDKIETSNCVSQELEITTKIRQNNK